MLTVSYFIISHCTLSWLLIFPLLQAHHCGGGAPGSREWSWFSAGHSQPAGAGSAEWGGLCKHRPEVRFLRGSFYISSKHFTNAFLQSHSQFTYSRAAVLNSSPRAPPLCAFLMLLLSLQTFVLIDRKCPAKWTSHDIPPWFQFEANVFHS